MKKTVSHVAHVAMFAILIGIASTLWLSREYVSDVIAGISSTGSDRGSQSRQPRNNSIIVVVERVKQASNNVVIEAIGTGRARRHMILNPETSGEVRSINVRAGQKLKRGDVVLKLDSIDAELAINTAKNKLQEAQWRLDRATQLRNRKVGSTASVDDADNLLERSRIELRQAEENLAKRTLRAPFNGIAGIAKVEIGDRVSTTTEIVSLDDRSEILIEFSVPELYLLRLSAGQEVTAITPSMVGETFTGRIDQIDSRIDPSSRSFIVRAILPNDQDRLRPGMSFAVEITLEGKSYPLIPELALIWSKGKSHVWLVDGGKAQLVEVKIVKRLNSTILIEGEIKAGNQVVIEGVQRLKPGSDVTYAEPDRPSAPLTN